MKYIPGTNLTVEEQERVIYTLKHQENLDPTSNVLITHLLCKTARNNYPALMEFLTTDKEASEIAKKYNLKNKNYLYKWRQSFLKKCAEHFYNKEADNTKG